MRVATWILISLVMGCGEEQVAMPDARPVETSTCTDYLELSARWFKRELPYLEPMPSAGRCHVFVQSPFMALWGESDPQPDNTTCVWATVTYHRLDGTTELGTVGRQAADDEACVWVTPVRVDP